LSEGEPNRLIGTAMVDRNHEFHLTEQELECLKQLASGDHLLELVQPSGDLARAEGCHSTKSRRG